MVVKVKKQDKTVKHGDVKSKLSKDGKSTKNEKPFTEADKPDDAASRRWLHNKRRWEKLREKNGGQSYHKAGTTEFISSLKANDRFQQKQSVQQKVQQVGNRASNNDWASNNAWASNNEWIEGKNNWGKCSTHQIKIGDSRARWNEANNRSQASDQNTNKFFGMSWKEKKALLAKEKEKLTGGKKDASGKRQVVSKKQDVAGKELEVKSPGSVVKPRKVVNVMNPVEKKLSRPQSGPSNSEEACRKIKKSTEIVENPIEVIPNMVSDVKSESMASDVKSEFESRVAKEDKSFEPKKEDKSFEPMHPIITRPEKVSETLFDPTNNKKFDSIALNNDPFSPSIIMQTTTDNIINNSTKQADLQQAGRNRKVIRKVVKKIVKKVKRMNKSGEEEEEDLVKKIITMKYLKNGEVIEEVQDLEQEKKLKEILNTVRQTKDLKADKKETKKNKRKWLREIIGVQRDCNKEEMMSVTKKGEFVFPGSLVDRILRTDRRECIRDIDYGLNRNKNKSKLNKEDKKHIRTGQMSWHHLRKEVSKFGVVDPKRIVQEREYQDAIIKATIKPHDISHNISDNISDNVHILVNGYLHPSPHLPPLTLFDQGLEQVGIPRTWKRFYQAKKLQSGCRNLIKTFAQNETTSLRVKKSTTNQNPDEESDQSHTSEESDKSSDDCNKSDQKNSDKEETTDPQQSSDEEKSNNEESEESNEESKDKCNKESKYDPTDLSQPLILKNVIRFFLDENGRNSATTENAKIALAKAMRDYVFFPNNTGEIANRSTDKNNSVKTKPVKKQIRTRKEKALEDALKACFFTRWMEDDAKMGDLLSIITDLTLEYASVKEFLLSNENENESGEKTPGENTPDENTNTLYSLIEKLRTSMKTKFEETPHNLVKPERSILIALDNGLRSAVHKNVHSKIEKNVHSKKIPLFKLHRLRADGTKAVLFSGKNYILEQIQDYKKDYKREMKRLSNDKREAKEEELKHLNQTLTSKQINQISIASLLSIARKFVKSQTEKRRKKEESIYGKKIHDYDSYDSKITSTNSTKTDWNKHSTKTNWKESRTESSRLSWNTTNDNSWNNESAENKKGFVKKRHREESLYNLHEDQLKKLKWEISDDEGDEEDFFI